MLIPTGRILKYLIISLVFTLAILALTNRASNIRITFCDAFSPVLRTFNNIGTAVRRIIPFAALREENRFLKARLELFARSLEEAKALSSENERLRELLNFAKAAPFATVPARVIGRDPSNWSNTIIIDKGATYGLRSGKAVLSTKGLVGRVVETGKRSAKILLITDPNSKVGVLIQRNRQGGILIGRPDGKCKMIYISLDSDVQPGDKVITAGLGSAFPKGVLVGEVLRIDKEPGRLYKYAIVRPVQDFSRLEEVLCAR